MTFGEVNNRSQSVTVGPGGSRGIDVLISIPLVCCYQDFEMLIRVRCKGCRILRSYRR